MFRECLPKPAIFTVFRSNEQDQIVTSSVVGVEEIGDDAQQTEAAREDEKRIFVPELMEYALLEFEWQRESDWRVEICPRHL